MSEPTPLTDAQIATVLRWHQPVPLGNVYGGGKICKECPGKWPCETYKALTELQDRRKDDEHKPVAPDFAVGDTANHTAEEWRLLYIAALEEAWEVDTYLRPRLEAAESALQARRQQEEACMVRDGELVQILGKALGYAWYKDDQKNFPGATEEDGVCVGDHVLGSLVDEAAGVIAKSRQQDTREDGPCYYCGEMTDSWTGNPGKWPVYLPHADDPGKNKPHHELCVLKRLRLADRLEQESRQQDERVRLLEEALRGDASDLWRVTNAIKTEIESRQWITHGRGHYAWDDDRYRQETKLAFDAVLRLIEQVQHPAQQRYWDALALLSPPAQAQGEVNGG